MLEGAAFEVVPEARQTCPLAFELGDPVGGVGCTCLGLPELLLDSLAAWKLPAVVLGQMLATGRETAMSMATRKLRIAKGEVSQG